MHAKNGAGGGGRFLDNNSAEGLQAFLFGVSLSFLFLSFSIAQAAGLTPPQKQSILGLLSSFGADASVIASVTAALGGTAAQPAPSLAAFPRDLEYGMEGEDVRALQQWLNTHGYILADSGPGSLGQETTYFGDATRLQLMNFQQDHGIAPAAGYFGPKTLGVLAGVAPSVTFSEPFPLPANYVQTPSGPVRISYVGRGSGGGQGGPAPDTAPPVLSNGSPSGTLPLGTTNAALSLVTDEAATCRYSTSPGIAYDAMADTFATTGGTLHQQDVAGLLNGESYIFYVRCQDTAGNANASDFAVSFTVAADETSPTVALTAPDNNATVSGTVTLEADASDDVSVLGVQFKLDADTLIGAEVTSSPYAVAWDSTGVADGTHTLVAVARDGAGNTTTSSVITVTVDNTAPVISSIASTSVAAETATITWLTGEPATSKVVYGTTGSYGSATSSAALATSHSISLAGLDAATTYHFAVVSTDAAGNTSTSSDRTFKTQTGLFGVNISGPEFAPWLGQVFPNAADFAYLAGKGVTFVRLPIAWESLQPTLGGALNAAYLGKIQTALANAHAHGITVIVDLHNFGAYCDQAHWVSSGCGYAGNAGEAGAGVSFLGSGSLTQANFTDVWARLGAALADTPGLMGYGIMNEPSLRVVGTNLFFAPNGFADSIGTDPWIIANGSNPVQNAAGTNPLGAGYGPSWTVSGGSGFGQLNKSKTLANVPYVLSIYARVLSGTGTMTQFIGYSNSTNKTVTTSWQRFEFTFTPDAGSDGVGFFFQEAGKAFEIANAQFETGSTASAYQPSSYLPFAQAAITAIRGADASTPIYINGFGNGTAYRWPWANWELAALTGGNLVFEAHQYFDGAVAQGGGGGIYSGDYDSYGIPADAGAQEAAPFISWLQTTGNQGFIGEYAIPDNSKGDQASWLALQGQFMQSLVGGNVPSAMWYYGGGGGGQLGNNLNLATSSTANAGTDDPRLLQMLFQ